MRAGNPAASQSEMTLRRWSWERWNGPKSTLCRIVMGFSGGAASRPRLRTISSGSGGLAAEKGPFRATWNEGFALPIARSHEKTIWIHWRPRTSSRSGHHPRILRPSSRWAQAPPPSGTSCPNQFEDGSWGRRAGKKPHFQERHGERHSPTLRSDGRKANAVRPPRRYTPLLLRDERQ